MRMHLLALALLAAPSATLGKQPKAKPYTPPRELAHFHMGQIRGGGYAWYREYADPDGRPHWRVWATPVAGGNWYTPPFEIRDARDVTLGIDETAMVSRIPRIGKMALGGPDAGKIEPAGSPATAQAGNPEAQDCGSTGHICSLVDAYCWARFWKRHGDTILWGVVALVGLGIAALLIRGRAR